ncbi:hypothetical protein GIX45_08010 [Erwinia sp. CPCC 100877]|nr:hypothetical protein [Erwinia sp. CPCC 100877]
MKTIDKSEGFRNIHYHSRTIDDLSLTWIAEIFPDFQFSQPTILSIEGYFKTYIQATNKKHTFTANGFSKKVRESLTIALLEILERLCGSGERLASVRGYIEARSFLENKKQLFSTKDIYLGAQNSFGYLNNSNGTAIGSSLAEAKYFALMELIERDTFLNYWFMRKLPAQVQLTMMSHKELVKLIQSKGYKVNLYWLKNEFGYPVIWAVSQSINNEGFSIYSTTGIAKDLNGAIDKALSENIYGLQTYTNIEEVKKRGQYVKATGFHAIYDNACFYSLEENVVNFNYLKKAKSTKGQLIAPDSLFYEEELKQINCVLKKHTYESFFVLMSDAVLQKKNLFVVKALVPNFQQLVFGNQWQARINQERLLDFSGNQEMKLATPFLPHPYT